MTDRLAEIEARHAARRLAPLSEQSVATLYVDIAWLLRGENVA